MARSARQLWADKLAGKNLDAFAREAAAPVAVQRLEPFRGVVLGVDPSLRGTGLAVIDFALRDRPKLLHSETLFLRDSISQAACLGEIARRVTAVLEAHVVDSAAVEESIYVQNYQTALILGMARGAAISAIAMRGIEVHHYRPLRIKQAVAGFGRASKEQVIKTVQAHLGVELPSDEADAAATALCHAFTYKL